MAEEYQVLDGQRPVEPVRVAERAALRLRRLRREEQRRRIAAQPDEHEGDERHGQNSRDKLSDPPQQIEEPGGQGRRVT